MSGELLNSQDCLTFGGAFRSLMTACEVNGTAEEHGANAFDPRQEHMLPWVERNGIETARAVGSELKTLVEKLRRRTGTVWSGEFEFNHRWAASDAADFFDRWRREVTAAAETFEAQSILLLSLIQRDRADAKTERNHFGEICTVPISAREFSVLAPFLSIRDKDRWIYVESTDQAEGGAPRATLCWPILYCDGCRSELEPERDPDDTNDQWRVRCCDQEAFGNSIAELTMNWNLGRGRYFRESRHA